MQYPMGMQQPAGGSNNQNTNNIKIDLGDLAGKKDDKKGEVNIPMLMMMKQSV